MTISDIFQPLVGKCVFKILITCTRLLVIVAHGGDILKTLVLDAIVRNPRLTVRQLATGKVEILIYVLDVCGHPQMSNATTCT